MSGAMTSAPDLDLGFMIVGVVRYDPQLKTFILVNVEGAPGPVDPQLAFKKYEGQEVRFTLVSVDSIEKMAALVQSGDVELK